MKKYIGGYSIIDLASTTIYADALGALNQDKPVLVYDTPECYYADTISLDGTSIIITKGGKTITIANDNTITSSGIVLANKMEEITDVAGNKRFIEGDINLTSSLVTDGLVQTYGKWSLSGSHLMIVLAGEIPAGVTPSGNYLSYIRLPDYIDDKIYAIITGGADFVSFIKTNLIIEGSYNLSTEITVYLRRWTDTQLAIQNATTITVDNDNKRAFRIQFDLLIDDDYSE